MAVVWLNDPQLHAITKDNELYFHLPELAKTVLKKPVASVLQTLSYATKHETSIAEIKPALITNKASGMHQAMLAAGMLETERDFASKMLPSQYLSPLLMHFDKKAGAQTAEAIIAASKQQPTPSILVAESKHRKPPRPDQVPSLKHPSQAVIKQREEMEYWAVDDTSVRSNFKGVSKKTFDFYYKAAISPYLEYLRVKHAIPREHLRLSISGSCTVFDLDKIEGFDQYCQEIRKKDSFSHRSNTFNGLCLVAKFLTRKQTYSPMQLTKEQAFIKGLSTKAAELQTLFKQTPKATKEKV